MSIQMLIDDLRQDNRENVLEWLHLNGRLENPLFFFFRKSYKKRIASLAQAISDRTKDLKILKEKMK